jgi:hypothetical protein
MEVAVAVGGNNDECVNGISMSYVVCASTSLGVFLDGAPAITALTLMIEKRVMAQIEKSDRRGNFMLMSDSE